MHSPWFRNTFLTVFKFQSVKEGRSNSMPLILFGDQRTLLYLMSVHDALYERTLVFMFLVNKTNEVKCGLKRENNSKLFSCIKLN